MSALLELRRGGFVEAVHSGTLTLVTADGRTLHLCGDEQTSFFLRSVAKPFQLMSIIASGAVDQFGLNDKELAVAASSHSAEEEHICLVKGILEKIQLGEGDLRCGTHSPMLDNIIARMARDGIEPSAIHNNCSGKHSAMLAACLARDWATDSYDRADHPLQVDIINRLARFAQIDVESITSAVDGCGVPTFSLPVQNTALAFARLAEPINMSTEDTRLAKKVFRTIVSHPTLGSGKEGRLDSALMRIGNGSLLAKIGAEGVYAVALAPGLVDDRGAGLVLKLDEGINFNRATGPIVVSALLQLGVLSQDEVKKLASFASLEIGNSRGEIVGEIRPLFDFSH